MMNFGRLFVPDFFCLFVCYFLFLLHSWRMVYSNRLDWNRRHRPWARHNGSRQAARVPTESSTINSHCHVDVRRFVVRFHTMLLCEAGGDQHLGLLTDLPIIITAERWKTPSLLKADVVESFFFALFKLQGHGMCPDRDLNGFFCTNACGWSPYDIYRMSSKPFFSRFTVRTRWRCQPL